MKKYFRVVMMAVAMALMACGMSACDNVPSGYVGVKVQKYGDDRGVQLEVKGPGRYFVGPTADIFVFPTFTQSYIWDKANGDESFSFQTVEGLSVNTDIGISYSIPRENAPKVFQKYRRGVDEITGVYLRAMVRDSLNMAAASMGVEDVYGKGKAQLQATVEKDVKIEAAKVGITVEKVYFVGEMRLPDQIRTSISNKMAAAQQAQQKETELKSAEADAAKEIARAKGDAEAIRIKSEAMRSNPMYLQDKAIDKWDGKLPLYTQGVPFVKTLP
ncbi:HflC/HflK family inner membrane lipoprotein [Burkholderia phage BcepF1]|uniref:HflC/HflK family inner membrane lipoprotein n=1 Tax=Burkholderia phage BcepF1 TaxID=2886897 RepID=A1YZQ6_9CAUD|nr:lipoprotein [Burkholderia phage BcepF1]ABL96733.1 HflC/HflK family inner membrane lipoprotein [Burkholderia phage BcepF1]